MEKTGHQGTKVVKRKSAAWESVSGITQRALPGLRKWLC